MENMLILMDTSNPSVIINSDAAANKEANTTATVAQESAQTSANTSSIGMQKMGIGYFLWILALIVLFYFFIIRPQKKREKEMKELQEGMQVGDEIRTSSGFYGKIVEIEDNKVIVEFGTNRGVKIPVAKSEIYAVQKKNDAE